MSCDYKGRQGSYGEGIAAVYHNSNTADTVESTTWNEITHPEMDTVGDGFINQGIRI